MAKLMFADSDLRFHNCIQEGDNFYQQGDLVKSVEYYLQAIELVPESADTYLKLGNALLEQDQWQLAKEYLQSSLAYEAGVAKAYYYLGLASEELGEKEDAVDAYCQALKLDNTFDPCRSKLEKILTQQGLDWKFYCEYHQDEIGDFSPESAFQHWLTVGKHKDFCRNEADFYQRYEDKLSDLPQDFEPENYLYLNPNLAKKYSNNKYRATRHFLLYGQAEQREYGLNSAKGHFIRGEKLVKLNLVDEAIAAYCRALQLDSTLQPCRNKLKELLLQKDFNWQFYSGYYQNEIGSLEPEAAYQHWQENKQKRSLCCNESDFYQRFADKIANLPQNFKPENYLYLNPDVNQNYKGNKYQAIRHFLLHSKKEKREYDLNSARGHFLRGRRLSKLNRIEEAASAYLQALELDSAFRQCYDELNSLSHQACEVALGGILQGWLIVSNKVDPSVNLKVIIDQKQIAVVETTQFFLDRSDRLLPITIRKFEVQLSIDLLDDQEHSISLIPISKTQENLTPISFSTIIPRRGFGVIDKWNGNCLQGWVLPDNHVDVAAMLDVHIDGTFYKEVKANILRRDLIKHRISAKGENGFEIALPTPPGTETKYEVEIFFKGTRQNLKRSPATITYDSDKLSSQFGQFSQLHSQPQPNVQQVTILIPVYNAYDAVQQCLSSVFQQTSRDAKLIIINDASPDDRVGPMLEKAVANRPNVQLITNEQNLGYTKTINKGINLASGDDIILLNSDTSVGPRWLQNIRIAAYREQDIGTVTAISDNSGAFSVPTMGQANDFPVWLQPVEIARTINQHSPQIYPETPTGSGFCIYIRRQLLDDIGLFDEEAFPRGYGEENDFCMRSLRAGWRHIVDDRTLVYHVRSASFQGEKTALYKPGREVVDKRYPEYKALVTHFVHSPQMDMMRYRIRKLLENSPKLPNPRPRVLFVISTKTGGTPQTNQDLMTGLGDRYQPMLLICNAKEISFYDARPKEHLLLEEIKLSSPINPTAHTSKEYDNIVGDLLIRYGIELVHIRHIAWHSISLASLTSRLDIPTILSIHDFYTICPTVNLLDENLTFCGGECTATDGRCPTPIWSEYRLVNLKHNFIKTWQHNMAKMFQYIDAFVTTAPSAREMMTKIYPQLEQANFKVIPHGRDFPHLQTKPIVFSPPKPNKPLKVLFPGNISSSKGAELIVAIKKLDVDNRLEFHFLGNTRHFLKPIGKLHGTYTRADFDRWMQKIKPHCVGIFSIWPETYCHTLTESWASGVPVVAINKGAVGERIARHGCGWLIDEVDPQVIYDRLLVIADDTEGYSEKMSYLNQWQLTYARQNNIATMAAQYHQLYQQVIAQSRPFELPQQTKNYLRVGVFVNSQLPPTAHIRVLEWLQHPLICDRLDTQFLDIDAFINDVHQIFELDVILIQRNIIQPDKVQPLIDICRERNLPIVYEIDDNLLNVPPDKDRKGVYARTAPTIKTLVTAATQVVVSTEPLAREMRQFNTQVTVIPNVIAESAWLKPIEVSQLPQQLLDIAKGTFKILYMGNSSHGEDLAMIEPVFERLYRENHNVRLLMVGGESEVAENAPDWYTRLSIPKGYESYQQFIPWFRQIAESCDLAIAPLVANEFNQYKSPLKFLQYSAVGLSAIYSNCTPYKEVVTDGLNGILSENTPESWHQAISKCIGNRDKLQLLAETAKKTVFSQYLMSNYADCYVNIFEQALNQID